MQLDTIDHKEIKKEFARVQGMEEFIDLMLEYFHRYSSEKYSERLEIQVPGLSKTYGTPVPVLSAIAGYVAEFLHKDASLGILLLKKLWDRGSREERRVACEALGELFRMDSKQAHRLAMNWMADLDNWEICDALALDGYRPFAEENTLTALRHSTTLVKSPNPWIRRFGIVSLIPVVPLIPGEGIGVFLDILKGVMKDPDENVQKAVAWLLRELSPRDRFRVEKFLDYYSKKPSPSTRYILREGSRKLPPDRRKLIMEKMSQ